MMMMMMMMMLPIVIITIVHMITIGGGAEEKQRKRLQQKPSTGKWNEEEKTPSELDSNKLDAGIGQSERKKTKAHKSDWTPKRISRKNPWTGRT